jgi:hypothetical protein
MSTRPPMRPTERARGATARRRSTAWVLWALIALVAAVGAFAPPGPRTLPALLVAGLCALYARYLYRGGRVVLFFLPGCLVAVIAGLGATIVLGVVAARFA